jgi:hypothetical protein
MLHERCGLGDDHRGLRQQTLRQVYYTCAEGSRAEKIEKCTNEPYILFRYTEYCFRNGT